MKFCLFYLLLLLLPLSSLFSSFLISLILVFRYRNILRTRGSDSFAMGEFGAR